jgi:hypothetical protein
MSDELNPAPLDPNAAPTPAAQDPAPTPDAPVTHTPAPQEPTPLNSEVSEDGLTFEFTPTGDSGLDVALSFVGNLGIGGTDPALVAAAAGNFALLEAKLDALGDKAKGWERMVNLAKDAFQRSTDQLNATAAKTTAAILSVVGGQETWTAVRDWTAQNATADEKKEINKLIDGGPIAARAAAILMLDLYKKASGTTVTPKNPAPSAGAPEGVSNSGRLNPTEYATAVRALYATLGSRMETSPEYRALQQRLVR